MNRFLTLASTGLFATGLAILPVSAFAQSTPPAGVDAKSTTTTGVVGSTAMPHKADAGKVVAAPAPSSHATDPKGDKAGAKAAVTTAPATGSMTTGTTATGTTATGGAKVTTAPAPSATSVAPMPKSGG
jgi:hypothetical protein